MLTFTSSFSLLSTTFPLRSPSGPAFLGVELMSTDCLLCFTPMVDLWQTAAREMNIQLKENLLSHVTSLSGNLPPPSCCVNVKKDSRITKKKDEDIDARLLSYEGIFGENCSTFDDELRMNRDQGVTHRRSWTDFGRTGNPYGYSRTSTERKLHYLR